MKNETTWVVKHNHTNYGDVQMRLGRDSKENLTLYITTLCRGIQQGTYLENVEIDALTNKTKEDLDIITERHIKNMSNVFDIPSDGYEKNWFQLFNIDLLGDVLVNFQHHNSKIVFTIFDSASNSFWESSIIEEQLHEIELGDYENNLEKLERDIIEKDIINQKIIDKVKEMRFTEEDWIL